MGFFLDGLRLLNLNRIMPGELILALMSQLSKLLSLFTFRDRAIIEP